jgi:hypothetical protein
MGKSITFDTLQYAKKLKNAGLNDELAEIQAEALKEIIEDNLATKRDLEDLKKDLTIRMGTMFAVSVSILSILLTVLSKVH